MTVPDPSLSFQGSPDEGRTGATPPAAPVPPASKAPEGGQEPGKESQAPPVPPVEGTTPAPLSEEAVKTIAQSAADSAVAGYDKRQKGDQAAAAAKALSAPPVKATPGEKAARIQAITAEGTALQQAAGVFITKDDTAELNAIKLAAALDDDGKQYLATIRDSIAAKQARAAIPPSTEPQSEGTTEAAPEGQATRAAAGIGAGGSKANPIANETNPTVLLNEGLNPGK